MRALRVFVDGAMAEVKRRYPVLVHDHEEGVDKPYTEVRTVVYDEESGAMISIAQPYYVPRVADPYVGAHGYDDDDEIGGDEDDLFGGCLVATRVADPPRHLLPEAREQRAREKREQDAARGVVVNPADVNE